MYKYILFLFSIVSISTATVFSQSDLGYLGIKGSIKFERDVLSGAKILVFKNGVQEKTYPVDSKGKFDINIDLNCLYEIVVTKQGYYSKKLSFNTKVPKDELGIWSYKFLMTMIPEVDGFNASLLDNPIGKIMYVDKLGEFDYDEAYTFNMLKQLENLMKEYEKARREAFKKLITQADAAFENKDYDTAMEIYDKAIDLDPYDPYPDEQLYVIGKILQQDQNAQKNYDENIAQADAYFQQKDYLNAKKYYTRAIKYIEKPYPKTQIVVIDGLLNNADALLADQIARDKAYTEAVAAGDRSFITKQYEPALAKFNEATNLKPTEKYPKDKIAELNILIAQLAKDKDSKESIEKAYRDAIAEADAGFGRKEYIQARTNYVKASSIKPVETYPKTKITEIDNLLAANKSIDEKYNGFIAVADKAFIAKEYESAKNNYKQALSIKPNEVYPASKIKEIDALLLLLAQQRQKDVDGNYTRLIATADASFNKKDYEVAKNNYTQALQLKSNEPYPKQRIAEIDNLLAALASKKQNYDMAIARADNNFNIDKLQEAKVDYQQALSIFPNEQYPQTRINEIENRLLALKNADEQRSARDNAYAAAIAKGDALFTEKKYQESKNSYSQALSLKQTEAYPKQKIAEIDQLILAQKAIDDKYNALIATADQQFVAKKYTDARTTYANALTVKATEVYPKQKIAEIDQILTSQKDLDERYNTIIATADQHFNAQKYTDARTTYSNALQLKAEEAYPKQKIAEIDQLLASQKDLDGRYIAIISTADGHFLNEKYEEAKTTYTNALQLKPTESYPKQKITEIDALLAQKLAAKVKYDLNKRQFDQLLAQADGQFNAKSFVQAKGLYQQASAILPSEMYPKQKIIEIDNLLAGEVEKERKYKEAIASADQLFGTKAYGEALVYYNQASGIRPAEMYPKQRVIEITKLLEDLRKNEATYDNYIKLADAAFSSNNLESAKGQYQAATGIKPAESYPKQRIVEIDKLLAEKARMAGEREKLESQYKTLVANADLYFNQKNYAQAKTTYEQALQLKSSEMYPKERIAEIDNIVSTLAAQQKSYDQKMAEGASLFSASNFNGALTAYQQASQVKPDEILPKQKITELQGLIAANTKKQEQYQGLITQADNLFNQKSYSAAKPIYQQAGTVLPNEAYPKNQIIKIEALLADAAKHETELQNLMKTYNAKVAEADKLFAAQNYNPALSAYMDAKMIKGDETYPDQQIAKINQITKANAAKLEADYSNAIKQGDQLKAAKLYIDAKQNYNVALGLKPNDAVAKAKIAEIDNLIALDKQASDKQAKIDADYNSFILQGDAAFKGKAYPAAISNYKNALALKAAEKYPKDQIELCERKIQEDKALAAAEEDKRRKAELAASHSSFDSKDFDYTGEQRDNKFLNELAKQYPEGVTTENYDKPNKKIKRVIVNRSGIAKEYIEVIYSYGTYYFRNGQNISRAIFFSETRD